MAWVRGRGKTPFSVAGQWLVSFLLQQAEDPEVYRVRHENAGVPKEQELLSAEVFRAVVPSLFPSNHRVEWISQFCIDMANTVKSPNDIDPLQAEALIRAALGEEDVFTDDIGAVAAARIHVLVVFLAVLNLKPSEAEVLRWIVDGESRLEGRGVSLTYRPESR